MVAAFFWGIKSFFYFCIGIVLWCNGSTAVFGSACLGSNPGKTTYTYCEK